MVIGGHRNHDETGAIEVVGVLDVVAGTAVHAVAGRRDQYRPLRTQEGSDDPVDIARALLATGRCHSLYVADLDAIRDRAPQWGLLRRLAGVAPLVVDLGLRGREDVDRYQTQSADSELAHVRLIVASETWEEPTAGLVDGFADPPIYSLDLRDGVVQRPDGFVVSEQSPVQHALDTGCRDVIVLDIAYVGVSKGLQTAPLCRQLAQAESSIRIWTGGGVGLGADELQENRQIGVQKVLVGTALYREAGLTGETLSNSLS